ncbi:endo-1,3-beta glucanase [Ascochyta clinopodiicola]|nr:endo-1,3-beta glucanase [Ascochyta clinopodiicola]
MGQLTPRTVDAEPYLDSKISSQPPKTAIAFDMTEKTPRTWRERRNHIFSSFGYGTTAVASSDDVPPDNIFVPFQADAILPQVPISNHHPVPRKGIEDDDLRTLHTNKFYANAFLGEQNQPIWTHPYALWWGKGTQEPGMLQTWGMNIGHVEEIDLQYGPGEPPRIIHNPRKQPLILSATELDAQTTLTTDTHLPFSVNINLNVHSTMQEPNITFPAVQGMSFVTAGYRNATPTIQIGGRGFAEFKRHTMIGRTAKYRIRDFDGREWLIYVSPVPGFAYNVGSFVKIDTNTVLGPSAFQGIIQVAKNPIGTRSEVIYDRAAGAFVCEAKLTAVVDEMRATYSFSYTKIGNAPLLIFALPHHIQSLDPELRWQVTDLQLRTSTKGMATAVWAEKLTFIETNLPVTMSFGPWSPTISANAKMRCPSDVLAFIGSVAERDLRRAMTEPIPPDSYYYAGKALAKFAVTVWVIKDVLGNNAVAAAGLVKLKQEMASWAKGLFESADGKDQESTSEDGFASYAMKMWGKVTGDINMEKRGNLMLSIQARSFNTYFYLLSTSSIHPARFTPNKITGILFENKIDYTTYFGDSPALVHGIHMVPLNPSSAFLRPRAFVREEWDALFSHGRALDDDVEGGWRGVLHANLALADPKASFRFFRDGVGGFWDERWIDGGASRTWYLVWAAGLVELAKGR